MTDGEDLCENIILELSEMEESDEELVPIPEMCSKIPWQETLVSLVAAQQQQLAELTRQSKMATSQEPTPSVSSVASVNAHVSTASTSGHFNTQFKLTTYDPDKTVYSMEEWLDDVTKLKDELHVSDTLMISKAGEALKHRAQRYFCDWRPLRRNWETFCNDMIIAFPDSQTPGARGYLAATLRSRDCDSLSDYGIQKLRSINRFHKDFPWETTLSMVEYGLDHEEVRSCIRVQKPGSERELLKIMSEFDAHRKRKYLQCFDDQPYTRKGERPREKQFHQSRQSKIKGTCFKCGRQGHHQDSCRRFRRNVDLPEANPRANRSQDERNKKSESNPPSCSHCKKLGHNEENCWFKNGNPKKAFVMKK